MVAGEIHETQEQLLVQRVMEIGLEIIEGQARPRVAQAKCSASTAPPCPEWMLNHR
jgi:hypothetical protein